MTRNELQLRENAVLCAYKDNDIDRAVNYVMELYKRNKEKNCTDFVLQNNVKLTLL